MIVPAATVGDGDAVATTDVERGAPGADLKVDNTSAKRDTLTQHYALKLIDAVLTAPARARQKEESHD